jgi:cholesterol oxidase
MALLKGLEGVRSAICSQLTLHPVTDWVNYLKADTELVNFLDVTNTHVVNIRANEFKGRTKKEREKEEKRSKTIDTLLYRLPTPDGEECNNPVCHRIFSIFGPSYTHAQLNHETHIGLEEMFGEISTDSFKQLAEIIRLGYVVDRDGRNVYLPHVERLKLPLSFMAGEKNLIFFPETSTRTFAWLKAHNGDNRDLYQRKVFPNYAHMDLFIGRDAAEREGPFEYIVEQLERFPAAESDT